MRNRFDIGRALFLGASGTFVGIVLSVPLALLLAWVFGLGTHGSHFDFPLLIHFQAAVTVLALSSLALAATWSAARLRNLKTLVSAAAVIAALIDIVHAIVAYHSEPFPRLPFEGTGAVFVGGDFLPLFWPLLVWFAIVLGGLTIARELLPRTAPRT